MAVQPEPNGFPVTFGSDVFVSTRVKVEGSCDEVAVKTDAEGVCKKIKPTLDAAEADESSEDNPTQRDEIIAAATHEPPAPPSVF